MKCFQFKKSINETVVFNTKDLVGIYKDGFEDPSIILIYLNSKLANSKIVVEYDEPYLRDKGFTDFLSWFQIDI